MDTKEIRDRIAACLYGGALGDALGYVVEFHSWGRIQAEQGPEGIRELLPEDGEAIVSDDTQMTLFTAEGLCLGCFRSLEAGTVPDPTGDIYEAYLCWLDTQGTPVSSRWSKESLLRTDPRMRKLRAPGNTCLRALRSGQMGTMEKPINNSKGCGGVMRTAPLGFLRSPRTRESLLGAPLLRGAEAAAITHGHPMGWVPAGMLSDIVDRCLYGEYASLRKLVEDSLQETLGLFADVPGIADFEDLMRRAMALSERPVESPREIASVDEPAIRSLGGGWVGDEALAIAVYAALRYPDDLKACLRAAVNHGGDSDSTGAIAGNILGARLGLAGIPEDWRSRIELSDRIEELADRMQQLLASC